MVDNACHNGGCKSSPLPLPQAHKQLGGVEDDGVDACPLLEECASNSQDQLGPVLAGEYGSPRVLNLCHVSVQSVSLIVHSSIAWSQHRLAHIGPGSGTAVEPYKKPTTWIDYGSMSTL